MQEELKVPSIKSEKVGPRGRSPGSQADEKRKKYDRVKLIIAVIAIIVPAAITITQMVTDDDILIIFRRATPTPTSTLTPTPTHTPSPTLTPSPTSTPTPTPTLTLSPTATLTPSATRKPTETATFTPTITSTAIICEQHIKILKDLFITENVNKALKLKSVDHWTDTAVREVYWYFAEYSKSIPIQRLSSVEILDQPVHAEKIIYRGVCRIEFEVKFILEDVEYTCDGQWKNEESLLIHSDESYADIEFSYYPDGGTKEQINQISLSFDPAIYNLCAEEP